MQSLSQPSQLASELSKIRELAEETKRRVTDPSSWSQSNTSYSARTIWLKANQLVTKTESMRKTLTFSPQLGSDLSTIQELAEAIGRLATNPGSWSQGNTPYSARTIQLDVDQLVKRTESMRKHLALPPYVSEPWLKN